MATLKKPQLLLLDEHTAALDPKTAAKVLEITDMIVNRDHLTTMMITHNMRDAITHGNRLIMDVGRERSFWISRAKKRKSLQSKISWTNSKKPAVKNFPTIPHFSAKPQKKNSYNS